MRIRKKERDFFDISKNSKAHFDGLAISKETKLCEKWMNQYPVVFISFKDIDGNTFESAYGMLKDTIANICKKFSFLVESSRTDSADREIFKDLRFKKATPDSLKSSLFLLTRMLSAHYGKKTILLVDEYDVPLFEVKHADKDETLEHGLQEAIDQITEKRYLEGIDEFETVVSYGIAFQGKKCMIQVYPAK